MSTTSDPTDPRLTRGVDDAPAPMADAYLVLSDEERRKGFVRPYRAVYIHVGRPGPTYPLRDLTAEEQERNAGFGDAKFEEYPESERPTTGRYWTQEQLDAVGKGCQTETRMGQAIAETYARQPSFYGATYCVRCSMHRPVGKDGEFVWPDGSRVGT